MIRKSGCRFSEKIMLQRKNWTMIRFNSIGSWSGELSSRHDRGTNESLLLDFVMHNTVYAAIC
jgi:hypothetical protein